MVSEKAAKKETGMDEQTFESPDDRDGRDYEDVPAFDEEGIPKPELGLEGHAVREERDVPLRRIARRRDHVLFLFSPVCVRLSKSKRFD